jgi:hypothetical protein
MPRRTEFPNTAGAFVPADGNPLIEIQSDGSHVETQIQGGHQLSELNEGDKAAVLIQTTRYFDGDAAAAEGQSGLAFVSKVARPKGDDSPEQVAYFDGVDAQRAKDAADYAKAMSTGLLSTPGLAERRAADQQAALEVAFVAAKLPEEDRRVSELELPPPVPEPTPHLGSSEPGFVPPPAVDAGAEPQEHVNRIHALLDVVETKLASAEHWAVQEVRTLLHELGATAQ